jgi:DNA-directed RNA polymerase subunit RPC12/RpoP
VTAAGAAQGDQPPLYPKIRVTRNRKTQASRTQAESENRVAVKSPLLKLLGAMLEDEEERQESGMAATHACPYCGGRALRKAGHDVDNGVPVCLVKKGLFQW